MSFFSPDYSAPGVGVPKGEPQKKGPVRYFVVAGRKFWDLVVLNLLYFLCSIPAILIYSVVGWFFLGGAGATLGFALAADGISELDLKMLQEGMHLILSIGFGFLMTVLLGSGAPRAGMTYVLRNYSREEHAFLWSDFREYSKKNIGRGTIVFLIDIVFTFVICLDMASYASTGTFWGLIASYVAFFLFIIYIIMHPYLYMILVTFDLKLSNAYKNAFILSAVRIFQNAACLILAALMSLVVLELTYQWNMLLFLIFMVLFSFPCLILDMNAFSVVKKYMIREK